MLIGVHNLYSGVTRSFEGTPAQVEAELVRAYGFLNSEDPAHRGDVAALIEHLNSAQGYEAAVLDAEPEQPMAKAEGEADANLTYDHHVVLAMLGHDHQLHRALEAARFLAGGKEPAHQVVRQALWQADGDVEEAALVAYGLEASEANLRALRAIRGLAKAEVASQVPRGDVQPGHPDAQEAAQAIADAFRDRFVVPVQLGGKHSAGSMLARDQDSGVTYLLKPGVGASPAAGAQQDPASQAAHEAAFWHAADRWHLGGDIPRADLIVVDGRPYAAIRLLPWDYKTLELIRQAHPGRPAQLLAPYLARGQLHRWGALDAILGQTDRHAGNMMVKGDDVKLIDNGSAFAGTAFDPAGDRLTFVPYYLRFPCTGKFSALSPEDRLRCMVRVSADAERDVRTWLEGLQESDLDVVLLRYGVDPGPSKVRLAKLKALAAEGPSDLAINRFWIET